MILDLEYYKKSKNYKNNICGIDEPHGRETTYERWHDYPIQDFTYNYNDWGFRANFNYDEYVGKPVNLLRDFDASYSGFDEGGIVVSDPLGAADFNFDISLN